MIYVFVIQSILLIFAWSIYYHRGIAHNHIKFSRPLDWFFRSIFYMFGTGSDKYWMKYLVAQHRLHHATSGSHLDPISLKHNFMNAAFPVLSKRLGIHTYNISDHDVYRYGKDIKPYEDWIQRNIFSFKHGSIIFNIVLYWLVTSSILYAIVMPFLLFFTAMIFMPVLANIVTHGFGINLGYGKNYKNDDSKNIIPFGIFMFGEELHNNHHNYPNKVNFAIRKFEFDLGYLMMVLLEKVNLLKIKRT